MKIVIKTFVESLLFSTWYYLNFIDGFHYKFIPDFDLISFILGQHGDFRAFDGTGGTLAHTFLSGTSRYTGDIHFDDDETWSVASFPGELWIASHFLRIIFLR